MNTAELPTAAQPTTFAQQFGTVGPMAYVRGITASLLGMWDVLPIGKRSPLSVAKLKSDVRENKAKPVEHLLRLSFAAIDAGIPLARVVAFLDEMKQAVEHYADRRERRLSAGVLPFRQVFARLNARAAVEDGEAEAAIYELNVDCVQSLRAARSQLLESIAADETRLAKLTERIVELEASL